MKEMICLCTESRILDEIKALCQESNLEVLILYCDGSAILRTSNKSSTSFPQARNGYPVF